jgi:hypothetical protein
MTTSLSESLDMKMKKIIWTIVVLVIVGYLATSYFVNKAKHERELAEELAETKRAEQKLKSAVVEMVSRRGAVDDWESHLSKGESVRLGPILTVELEKLWLGNRPILFVGAIKDVITYNESHYEPVAQ